MGVQADRDKPEPPRFESLTKRLLAVPKDELEQQDKKRKKRNHRRNGNAEE